MRPSRDTLDAAHAAGATGEVMAETVIDALRVEFSDVPDSARLARIVTRLLLAI